MESVAGERALDERVAETVLGWKWVTSPAYRGRWLLPPHEAAEGEQQGLFEVVRAARHMQKPVISNPEGNPKLPHFSSDLHEAWGLVEYIATSSHLLSESGMPVRVRFATLMEKSDLWFMSAGEAARAICSTALRVIGD